MKRNYVLAGAIIEIIFKIKLLTMLIYYLIICVKIGASAIDLLVECFPLALSIFCCITSIVYNSLLIGKAEKSRKLINSSVVMGAFSFLYIAIYIKLSINIDVFSSIIIYVIAWILSTIFFIFAQLKNRSNENQTVSKDEDKSFDENKDADLNKDTDENKDIDKE